MALYWFPECSPDPAHLAFNLEHPDIKITFGLNADGWQFVNIAYKTTSYAYTIVNQGNKAGFPTNLVQLLAQGREVSHA
jgi:hypothetical protein